MKKLRELIQEKILISAHYMDGTRAKFHTHAKDEHDLKSKVSQLHNFVRKEKKHMIWIASMPNGTTLSGRLYHNE